jgi:A/G-specific adenine glycosylase
LTEALDATSSSVAQSFATRVIDWQRRHGRHDLPWQGTRDPYRIWLSEIMLQQTQVSTVIPYYQRFVGQLPDAGTLAAADLDQVLALWSGLGYYSRARNLHRAAQVIVERHAGVFPGEIEAVVALPGVGRSTAAAICALAFGQRQAILDGNVKRVLARHAGIDGWPGERQVEAALWQQAEARLPAAAIEPYTQGLMDLGASLCARRRPDCANCPVADDCAARLHGRTQSIPAPRPRRIVPQRSCQVWVVLDAAGRVLLEQRPAAGIWGGLWSLPEQVDPALQVRARGVGGAIEPLPAIDHAFTHFRLRIEPLLVRCQHGQAPVALMLSEPGRRWVGLDALAEVALPAPVRVLLKTLAGTPIQAVSSPCPPRSRN